MFGRSKYKRFLLLALLLLMPLTVLLGLFNYYIDPMWCFKHANRYNTVQSEIDDRQQKTNYLTFGHESYDTLMIGNSRVRMMDHNDFGPHVFNYALAGMIPIEYEAYLDYARKLNGRDFKEIVLGLSFAHTNGHFDYFAGRPPSYYFANVQNPFYLYGMLTSGDVFKHAFANLKHARRNDITTYFDRNNVQHVRRERVQLDKTLAGSLDDSRHDYRSNFKYLERYRSILESIKKKNASSKITVFTTPVTQPLFCAMVTGGRLDDYKRWLREMVDVFGEVHHFEYLNSVTRDYRRYYMDGHHYYPETGRLIAHKIMGVADPAIPADFGMILTPSNIEEKLQEIEAASKVCR
jgi:hypothetical protein